MIVNMNVLCKVYLNDQGKQIWLSQINELPEEVKQSHPEIEQTIRNQIQPDDSITTELWGIMNIFGRYVSPMSSPFKRMTLDLAKNPEFKPTHEFNI